MITNKDTIILGIESSCDDTSVAIVKNGKMLANLIANQAVHASYGGVVPELASRAHQANIVPVVDSAIRKAGIKKEEIDAIAFTKGPGLLGSLLVGVSFAKSLSMSLNVPLIEVNHMRGHILAHFIQEVELDKATPEFPFLCLTVSGGHTQIVLVKDYLDMEVIGETIDDAVGEAFDKSAKIMGFPYPGGPLVDKYAREGNPNTFEFSIPSVQGFNYSFSGLKTQFINFLNKEAQKDKDFVENNIHDICASWQNHLIKYLLGKFSKAIDKHPIKGIAIAGGVSANSELRKQIAVLGKKKNLPVFIPDFQYCTDNAGMIAITGYHKFLASDFSDLSVQAKARLHM